MIIPIGHENQEVRRLPWVTFVIMGLCFIIHIGVSRSIDNTKEKLEEIGPRFVEYLRQHPYLELSPELEELIVGEDRYFKAMLETYRATVPPPEDESLLAKQQTTLDGIMAEIEELRQDIPYLKYGYIPTEKTFTGLLAYMFLHAGWLHLLGNLLFLYLSGPFMEDVWGRGTYAVFYILAGMVSAVLFAARYPGFSGPLIGASGAVSGAMGAFLIRHWNTKIRFAYMFSVLIRGTFSAPAWVMLPLWLVQEFMSARFMDGMVQYGHSGEGVAHWAHVFGFLFGVLFAVGMKFLRIEEKFGAPKIEKETTFVNGGYAQYEEAMNLMAAGETDRGYIKLQEAARQNSTDEEVVYVLWQTSKERGEPAVAAPFMMRLVESEIRHRRPKEAWKHFGVLKETIPDASPGNSQTTLAFIDYLVGEDEKQEAETLANSLLPTLNAGTPVGLLIQLAESALRLNPEIASKAVDLAAANPEVPELRIKVFREELEKLRKKAAMLRQAAPPDLPAAPPVPSGPPASPAGSPGLSLDLETPAAGVAVPPPIPIPPPVPPPPVPGPPPVPPAETVTEPAAMPPFGEGIAEFSVDLALPDTPGAGASPPEPQVDVGAFGGGVVEFSLDAAPEPPPPPAEDTPGQESYTPAFGNGMMEFSLDSIPDPPPPPEPPPPPPPPPPPEPSNLKALKITKAVLTSIQPDVLDLEIPRVGERTLSLNRVKALTIAKIIPADESPFLVIDLYLDDLRDPVTEIRTIRLFSRNFDPRAFFPDTRSMLEAYRRLMSHLLQQTGARPYPDSETALLRKINEFPSLKAFQASLLKLL